MMDGFVGMPEPDYVRAARRDLDEYVAHLPKTAAGHSKLTYEQAVGLQKLQFDYQESTVLSLLDCESGVVTRHHRPNHYLKRPPLAALTFGASGE